MTLSRDGFAIAFWDRKPEDIERERVELRDRLAEPRTCSCGAPAEFEYDEGPNLRLYRCDACSKGSGWWGGAIHRLGVHGPLAPLKPLAYENPFVLPEGKSWLTLEPENNGDIFLATRVAPDR